MDAAVPTKRLEIEFASALKIESFFETDRGKNFLTAQAMRLRKNPRSMNSSQIDSESVKETILSAKKSAPEELKKSENKKEDKSSKTIQELDREKLDNKFSKDKKGSLN